MLKVEKGRSGRYRRPDRWRFKGWRCFNVIYTRRIIERILNE